MGEYLVGRVNEKGVIMIGPVSSSPAIWTPATAPGKDPSAADRRNRDLFALLTPDDWEIISAAAGRRCGPDENGFLDGLQPPLAVTMALDRAGGNLRGRVTTGYLSVQLQGDQPPIDTRQLTLALDFLQRREERQGAASDERLPLSIELPGLI